MRIVNLETLLWIVRLGGVGAAAHHLHVTQPAVTRRIRELERELNISLFERTGRGIRLTAAGQNCFELAQRIVGEVATFRQSANSAALVVATIRMGVAEVIALTWLHSLLGRITADYPNVQIELDIDLSSRLLAKLEEGRIDIALVPGNPSLSGSTRRSLGAAALSWMCAPGFLPKSKILRPADLAEIPILTLSQGSNSHSVMTSWFADSGVVPKQVAYCNSLTVIVSLVMKHVGISLLPEPPLQHHIDSGTLHLFCETPAVSPVEYWAVQRPMAGFPILNRIIELACEESRFN